MRLFIGMKVPPELRERLHGLWSEVEFPWGDECRAIERSKWHFTLAFLGEVEPASRSALEMLMEKAIEKPPRGHFTFSGFQAFPSRNPTYIIARALPEPEKDWNIFIERLRDLVSVAAPNVDRKPWIPHVSLARARKGTTLPQWSQEIKPFQWKPTELTLVRSESNREGSIYTDLHVFPFDV